MSFFPFEKIRSGQKEFMDDVKKTIDSGSILLADASTGIGKTAAVLAPTLEYAVENNKVIFFLTPRHSQHAIVVETIKKINEQPENIRQIIVADIIGKKWLCNQEAVDVLPSSDFFEYCRRIKEQGKCAFYSNTIHDQKYTKTAYACLNNLKKIPHHAEEIKNICKNTCPYEVALMLAKDSNVIIGDYYHFFSLVRDQMLARIKRDLKDIILIVDEAHNLPSRLRDLLSYKISTTTTHYATKEAVEYQEELDDEIIKCIDYVDNILKKMYKQDSFVTKEQFMRVVQQEYDFSDMITLFMNSAEVVRDYKKRSSIGTLAVFMTAWSGENNGFSRIIEKEFSRGKNSISLNYNCLDCSIPANPVFNGVHSAVLMSGTLRPVDMYINLLGLNSRNSMYKSYQSDFPPENRINISVPEVTTKYTERNDLQYRKISDYINKFCAKISGNTAVFFPSYDIRNNVSQFIETDKAVFLEEPETTKQEKTLLYKDFIESHREGALLLGVQAGSMSEGVDYYGDALSAVIVVGVALEKPTLHTQALIDYYNQKFGKGWDYAYVYPAVLKALQTAGRCIRSETDRGICVFMDKRFHWSTYRKLFPSGMNIQVVANSDELAKAAERFFADKKL
ncbi:MAG: ATP-dependent DNA helicase [Candidatus Aenigmarchaeota archaeon]|nr:ATP-dependent DNA helicase [Candidatus Aenigmarchaeota archaeon]